LRRRAAGIANVNIDLMYGLPRQTVGDVIRSAELAASLAPSRLALFGYAHVPWFKPHQRLIDERHFPALTSGWRRTPPPRRWRNAVTSRSASIISPPPMTILPAPREPDGCTEIFRATRPIRPTR
jgi:hypothetical protein